MDIIATCAMHFEHRACQELERILSDLGDDKAKSIETEFTGVIVATTSLDPLIVVNNMIQLIQEEPWTFRYCLRIIPIQKTIRTTKTTIIAEARFIVNLIPDNCTYKIMIKRRGTSIDRIDLIKNLALKIPREVKLDNPDRIVLVEIIGKYTGISVLKPDYILSVHDRKKYFAQNDDSLNQFSVY